MFMNLKPQDILVVLKLIAMGDRSWSYVQLANELSMSASEINAGVKRCLSANLMVEDFVGGKNPCEFGGCITYLFFRDRPIER